MEGTSPDPTCLFVGARGVGKHTMIRALQVSPTSKPPVAADYSLRLDTKYYTADVAVRALSTQQQDEQQQLHADAWEQLQALVLIFDLSDEASFISVRSWAGVRDTDSMEVKLLVANKADKLQQQSTTASNAAAASCRTQWLQDAMSWCVDEGYEYIETAAGKPAVDAALQLDGEQQGVARVLAALQAHMWPGMVQKDWQPQTLSGLSGASTAAAAAVDAGSGSSCSSSACMDQDSLAADAAAQPAAAAAAADALASSNAGAIDTTRAADATMALPAQQQQQQQQLQKADQQPNSAAQLRQSSGAKSNTPTPQQQQQGRQQQQQQQQGRQQQQQQRTAAPADDDDEDEGGLDDFEQMMKQLQGMRTRLSHLPDDERRTAAADMALKLASMWGLPDEEASSEEGDAAAPARADEQQQLDVRK